MRISARNTLKGRIKRITVGAVNTEIIVDVGGGAEIVSVITKASADAMKLTEGSDVYAVVKASNVMIAVDH